MRFKELVIGDRFTTMNGTPMLKVASDRAQVEGKPMFRRMQPDEEVLRDRRADYGI